MDWVVGELTKQLDKLGLTENTIIIFSSDNGPVLDDGYADEAVAKKWCP
jgi:arylsulfatase A